MIARSDTTADKRTFDEASTETPSKGILGGGVAATIWPNNDEVERCAVSVNAITTSANGTTMTTL